LAKVSLEAYWVDPKCREHKDSIYFEEWFRLDKDGKTPKDEVNIESKDGKRTRKGKVDIHDLRPYKTQPCYGSIVTKVTYGLAKGVKNKTSWWGLANPGTRRGSGAMPNSGQADIVTENGITMVQPESSWGFTYQYAKGDGCCCIVLAKQDFVNVSLNGVQSGFVR